MRRIHYILCVLALSAVCGVAQAGDWELKETRSYGTGGRWEDGQKVRIDASFKNGQFVFERKESVGKNLSLYSTRARFTVPADTYPAGAKLSIGISFSEEGNRNGYAPYARVTILPAHPSDSPGIPASGPVDGQAVDESGAFVVIPPENLTLTAPVPSSGTRMAIVCSCNGMDVVYMYERNAGEDYAEGTASVNETVAGDAGEALPEAGETLPEAEGEDNFVGDEPDSFDGMQATPEYEGREESFPLLKLIVVILVAAGLIALILYLFRDKTPGAVADEPAHEAPAGGPAVCPSCGKPAPSDAKFCEHCGHKLKD